MSDPSEILKRRLRAVIDGTQTPGGLHFFAQIGGPMHELGMTTLQVSGTGAVVLGWRQDDDRLLYSYVLSNVDQMRFYTMLLDPSAGRICVRATLAGNFWSYLLSPGPAR